ncbi:hypothetical protein CDIK_1434 [Cucumispora dikerogammari]|nr:hypothetical protein CDIK_1434 [Cucumispora dikerogammari]
MSKTIQPNIEKPSSNLITTITEDPKITLNQKTNEKLNITKPSNCKHITNCVMLHNSCVQEKCKVLSKKAPNTNIISINENTLTETTSINIPINLYNIVLTEDLYINNINKKNNINKIIKKKLVINKPINDYIDINSIQDIVNVTYKKPVIKKKNSMWKKIFGNFSSN